MVQHAVDDTPQEDKNKKRKCKNDTNDYQEHDNIENEIDEKELYGLDKFGLDESHKESGKSAFGTKPEIIYDMKILNDINHIHDNKVNSIDEFNLLHDILNPSKRTKNVNSYYYLILHGCMNTHRGKLKNKNFRI